MYTYLTKRSKIFNEFNPEEQKEFFNYTEKKILPCVDNVYYSVFIKDDVNGNTELDPLLTKLQQLYGVMSYSHEPMDFFGELQLSPGGFNIYKYRLSSPDLYDIFVLDYLPTVDTPRLLVQLRAYGLWCHGLNKMINDSFDYVSELLHNFNDNIVIDKCRENRIDYCYHTNIIPNPHLTFSDANLEKHLNTVFNNFGTRGRVEKLGYKSCKVNLVKDYISFGDRRSNNVYVRIYNKALEVCELAYKSFFFEIWHQQGLINKYDKYCFEYAYEKKDYSYIHKARLNFYLEYGSDADAKEFIKSELSKNYNPIDYKKIADLYTPNVTTVLNIEYETKRKFYYYSDDFIENVLKAKSPAPHQLQRVYKILDNRDVFLDYLTSKTMSFIDRRDGSYVDWWERLRNVKLDVAKNDVALIREYSKNLDKELAVTRAFNAVATSALYSNIDGFDVNADIEDLLSNVNDNTLSKYVKNKTVKYKRLKNLLK